MPKHRHQPPNLFDIDGGITRKTWRNVTFCKDGKRWTTNNRYETREEAKTQNIIVQQEFGKPYKGTGSPIDCSRFNEGLLYYVNQREVIQEEVEEIWTTNYNPTLAED